MVLICPFCNSPIKEFHKTCKAIYTCGTEKIIGGWKQSALCKAKASRESSSPINPVSPEKEE